MPVCETAAEAAEQWNRAQVIVREERQRLKAMARHLPRGAHPRVRPCQFRFPDGVALKPTDAVRRFVLEHPGLSLERVVRLLSKYATFETVVLSLYFWKHERPETSIRHAIHISAHCRVTFDKQVFPRED